MKKISGLIFLLGSLGMLLSMVWVWMSIIVEIARLYGPGFGAVAAIVSFFLLRACWEWVSLPYVAWMKMWRTIDRRFD